MQQARLDDMVKGWFVGNFQPTLYATNDVEVAVKKYTAGTHESWHYHKIATEITVIISGKVEMAGRHYREGDIIVMEPGEATDFRTITDVITAVVKLPGANDDKYLVERD
jgi:quercetin dioxygenase-like cupin family protein